MGRITELLDTAHARCHAQNWPFSGALLPDETHELLQLAPGTRLIDVRSRAELELNGVIPGAVHVEWQSCPGWVLNAHLLAQPAPGASPSKESVLEFLEGQVAKLWLPDDVIFVEALPLGATGKVQKTALRERFGR